MQSWQGKFSRVHVLIFDLESSRELHSLMLLGRLFQNLFVPHTNSIKRCCFNSIRNWVNFSLIKCQLISETVGTFNNFIIHGAKFIFIWQILLLTFEDFFLESYFFFMNSIKRRFTIFAESPQCCFMYAINVMV